MSTTTEFDPRIPLWMQQAMPLTGDNQYFKAVGGEWAAEYAVHIEDVVEVDGDLDLERLGEAHGVLRRLAAGLAVVPVTGRQGYNVEVEADLWQPRPVEVTTIDEEHLVDLFVTSTTGMSSRVLLADIPAALVGITPAGRVSTLPYAPSAEWADEQADRDLIVVTGGDWLRLTLFVIPGRSRLADLVRELAFDRWMANAAYDAFASLAGEY